MIIKYLEQPNIDISNGVRISINKPALVIIWQNPRKDGILPDCIKWRFKSEEELEKAVSFLYNMIKVNELDKLTQSEV